SSEGGLGDPHRARAAADPAVEGGERELDLVLAGCAVAVHGCGADRGDAVAEVPGAPGDPDLARIVRAVKELDRFRRRWLRGGAGDGGARSWRWHRAPPRVRVLLVDPPSGSDTSHRRLTGLCGGACRC